MSPPHRLSFIRRKSSSPPSYSNAVNSSQVISSDTAAPAAQNISQPPPEKSASSSSVPRRSSFLKRNSYSTHNRRDSTLSFSEEASPSLSHSVDCANFPPSSNPPDYSPPESLSRMALRTSVYVSPDLARSSFPMDFPKDTPPEMVPILTLLHTQKNRVYKEGYLMILNDLNSEGKPANDRHWVEVYATLTGSVLSIFDANAIDSAQPNREPAPAFINLTNSTFKSIALLPSPNGDLANIIVLSTTLKNRYLLQFANPALLNQWTAALRLSQFEHTSLQEAYTGALLSAKGSKLNGIRTLLSETKFKHEDYVSVRFGSGMPWKKCWVVVTPSSEKKKSKKNVPPPGSIAFYEDKKKVKKPPLALITGSYAVYAVYPESSVLINGSTMIKIDGKVAFNDVEGEKDASVFLMPEAHPGVPGFETLIRFLIPVLDAFQLYGRPSRLNSDKADMRSLLFGMPSLPFTQYLETSDLEILVAIKGSDNWTPYDWTRNIKDLLARKMAAGYRGTGSIARPNSIRPRGRERSTSQPMPADIRASMLPPALTAVNEQDQPHVATIPLSQTSSSRSSVSDPRVLQQQAPAPPVHVIHPQRQAPAPPVHRSFHERSASMGQDPNNLLSTVAPGTGPISPLMPNGEFEQHQHHPNGAYDTSRHSYTPSVQSHSSKVHRRPVSAAMDSAQPRSSYDSERSHLSQQQQQMQQQQMHSNMFDPTANTAPYPQYNEAYNGNGYAQPHAQPPQAQAQAQAQYQ